MELSSATEEALIDRLRQHIDFAFQAVVNMHTGTPYGFEALLRGQPTLGFTTAAALFDFAEQKHWLASVDLVLREIALQKFAGLSPSGQYKCFINLDLRVIALGSQHELLCDRLVAAVGLRPDLICYEFKDDCTILTPTVRTETFKQFHGNGYQVAIDDFGTGTSPLKQFFDSPPDLIKIDPCLTTGIAAQAKKKLFLANIVDLAHVLGVIVVAEGVEEELDFLACKEIGCELVQGFLIAHPTVAIDDVRLRYEEVPRINLRDRRSRRNDRGRIENWMENIPTIDAEMGMPEVFDCFSKLKNRSFFPVLNRQRQPLGVIRECDIKGFVYSAYGKDLLSNRAYRQRLDQFITRCPWVDLRQSAEHLLEVYATNTDSPGIIVVDDFVYKGFLSSQALLGLLHEKNLGFARDQNPLTKLPGNNALFDYLLESLNTAVKVRFYVYFDFDNFKPFNDTFGFRQGDRVILLFAELMAKDLPRNRWFISHIGGDDFFAGTVDISENSVVAAVKSLLQAFSEHASSFYDQTSRTQGFIVAEDRYGDQKKFPLISCSAAILVVPGHSDSADVDVITGCAAKAKKLAKAASEHIYLWRI